MILCPQQPKPKRDSADIIGSNPDTMALFKERKPLTDPRKIFHYTDLQRSKPTRDSDPYEYLTGWGNKHQSEVIPGTLPTAQNNPQETRFGLYTEGITYSAFAAPRHANMSTYLYRARPAAAHGTLDIY
jgi:homogentisate 1,2-dioxygenase